ncbi:zeta toxin family protein [Variovorax paradoxus]|uniref:zeta toxin family protein n=1 Tax=Variovorax paradoxus TaxID=34073 RepID=UPI003D64FB2D
MAGSNPYRLVAAENERIFREEILPEKLKNIGSSLHPVEHPQMVIIGGQPGAGKSRTMGGVVRELMHQGGALRISPDEFRDKHPNFNSLNATNDRTSSSFTHEDAGIWAEKLEKYAREHKLNVILEGTLRTPENAAARLVEYKAAGYTTDVRVVATNERTSWQSVHARYEDMKAEGDPGRWVPKDGHDSAYKGVLDSVELIEARKLADRVGIYDRNGKAIYQNELKNGQWEHAPAAREALAGERSKPLTPAQWDEHLKKFDEVTRNVIRPGRAAGVEEIQEIQRLRARSETIATEQLGHAPAKSLGTRFTQLGAADAAIGATSSFKTFTKIGGAGSGVLMAYGAVSTSEQYTALQSKGNQYAADALLREYMESATLGLAGGFAAGAAYGAATGSWSGPGALATGLVGGAIGAVGGDYIAKAHTQHKLNHQSGSDGITYTHTAQGWMGDSAPAPASQLEALEYKRSTAVTSLAVAKPQVLDTRNITLADAQGKQTAWHGDGKGQWTATVTNPAYDAEAFARDMSTRMSDAVRRPGGGLDGKPGMPPIALSVPPLKTITADATTSAQLNQIAAQRQSANDHYPQIVAKAYVMDYYGRGWDKSGTLPEFATKALNMPSETHIKDPTTGKVWDATAKGFERTERTYVPEGGDGAVARDVTVQPTAQEAAHLLQAQQQVREGNAQQGARFIAQTYEAVQQQQPQALQRQSQSAPARTEAPASASAAVTNATSGPMREEPQAAVGHLTPQQIERITTHESRVVPTPGGMSFAEAHRRRDEPEQISAGSLQPVGKLDEIHRTKGGPLYRVHQAQEQALMRDLGIAQAQDRERFGNEPSLQRTLQPSVERTQERMQEQAPAPSRGAHAVAPVAPAHVSPARPPAGAEAMHSPATHASMAAPVHSKAPSDASVIAAAQAQAAAAQAQAVAARAELAEMQQQMARVAAERQDGLARRDERDERDQRDQPGTTQIAQGRDSRHHEDADAQDKQISATAVADTSRPLLREFSDPGHPQNALYNTLKDGLPQRTAPQLLSHLTAACYKSGIKQPDDLAHVVGREGKLHFLSRSLFSPGTTVDVTQPAPSVQQTMQDVQQFEQQRAADRAQYQAQAAAQANQQQGPVMG